MELSASGQVVQAFLSRSPAELAFYSEQFARALSIDMQAFSAESAADPTGAEALDAGRRADALFNSLGIPGLFVGSPTTQVRLWERTLGLLQATDQRRYNSIHKGTPFYFLGLASYLAEDFERALYYMDCALAQDRRLHSERWHLIPSGMFVRLDEAPVNQYGRDLVHLSRQHLSEWNQRMTKAGGTALSVEAYRAKLVNHAMQVDGSLRSAVTAFLSFLLEFPPRQTQLTIAPPEASSGEQFFLHLFKGGVLFETLLKTSPYGKAVRSAKPKAMLGDLLTDRALVSALGLAGPPRGLSAQTFDDLLAFVDAHEKAGFPFPLRAIRGAWGVRNATGHNLAWPHRPSVDDYTRLFLLVFGSVTLAVDRLYPPTLLSTGEA